jgi:hypothetical protein
MVRRSLASSKGGTAVNPINAGTNTANVIAVWQQDRWSNGGAQALMSAASFDGGHTWGSRTSLPFSSCAPGGLNYERASDPWVSIDPDGIAYTISISFNVSNNDNAVAAARSTDGGASWDHLSLLRVDNGQNQFFNDKESVTADPTRPGYAYAAWDQLAGPVDNPAVLAHNFSSFTGDTWFSRTTDGGQHWSTAKVIVPMRQRQQSIANVIVVGPPNGTLYDFFTLITATGPNSGPNSAAPHGFALALIKSTDADETSSRRSPSVRTGPSVSPTKDWPRTGQTSSACMPPRTATTRAARRRAARRIRTTSTPPGCPSHETRRQRPRGVSSKDPGDSAEGLRPSGARASLPATDRGHAPVGVPEQGSVMAFLSTVKLAALQRADGRCECSQPRHAHAGRCLVPVTLATARFEHVERPSRHGYDGLSNCEVLCVDCAPPVVS